MRVVLALVLGFWGAQAFAQARSLDVAKSRIAFIYTVEKKIPVEGRFPRYTAQVVFDEKQPEKGSIRMEIEITAIDTGNSDGDQEAKQPLWFDTAKFPKATFVSSSIRRAGERRYEALGTLVIKGRSRDATIPFTAVSASDGGLTTQGSFVVKRLLFGVGQEVWADVTQFADEVEIKFNLALGPPR